MKRPYIGRTRYSNGFFSGTYTCWASTRKGAKQAMSAAAGVAISISDVQSIKQEVRRVR